MKEVRFHYGKGFVSHTFKDGELSGVLESSINTYVPSGEEDELITEAMKHPTACCGQK